jgi:nitroimidazol reductase NimA-like FMN-containing flavoprotein (pyridoxamine 5'-phosphate oxidase superfamily)
MNDEKQQSVAKNVIANNRYMTLSTASSDGRPWISPVFFSYDNQFNLYWVSNKNSRHSILIRQNPQVAIVIFNSQAADGEIDAVYIEATVSELHDAEEISIAVEALGRRYQKDEFRVKSIDAVTNAATWRIYKANPKAVSKLTEGEYINGQYVDKRIEINLV